MAHNQDLGGRSRTGSTVPVQEELDTWWDLQGQYRGGKDTTEPVGAGICALGHTGSCLRSSVGRVTKGPARGNRGKQGHNMANHVPCRRFLGCTF